VNLLRCVFLVDYCNSVLACAPAVLLSCFHSVLNATTRLVFSANRSAHTNPLLRELHWLIVPERIQFRLCVLTYRCLNGTAPQYLSECILPASSRSSGRQLRSTESVSYRRWYRRHTARRSAIALFRWPQLGPGTLCRSESGLLRRSSHSGGN